MRQKAILDSHMNRIEDFARTYNRDKESIVLLPGGMGSQLDRSIQPYEKKSTSGDSYDPIWMDWGLLFNDDSLKVEILPNGRDVDNYIVRPNGPLRFLVKSYDATESYFRERGFNYIVFGYDWRRPLRESAEYLQKFLSLLRKRVSELRGQDPLPTTTILCHSMGGLVAKVFLHRVFNKTTQSANVNKWMARLITVATPFYGTSNHMRRYYKGQDFINQINGETGATTVANISGTLPGPYILMLLDLKTFTNQGNRLGLSRYPVRDYNDDEMAADPYDPAMQSRYPDWVRPEFIAQARKERRMISKLLPNAVIRRVFHIRGLGDKNTGVEMRWKDVL